MQDAQRSLGLTDDQLFTDWQHCLEQSQPDFIVLCPATGDHALWVERLAPAGLPLLMEKPMAASLHDADRMLTACDQYDTRLAINWPLVWVPRHRTAKRMIDEGRIGQLHEIHYYGGNRGPLWHTAGKRVVSPEEVNAQKPDSWFYKRSSGGGSLLDYLGYGVTLGTWFLADRNRSRSLPSSTIRRCGGRRTLNYHSPLRIWVKQIRNAVGYIHRSLDAPAATQMRLCLGGSVGTIWLVRLRMLYPSANP